MERKQPGPLAPGAVGSGRRGWERPVAHKDRRPRLGAERLFAIFAANRRLVVILRPGAD
jgi:hypothetical protein